MTAKSETPAAPDIAETLRQLAAANDVFQQRALVAIITEGKP